MTVIQARKILDVLAVNLTDEQIQEIIDCFSGLIEVGFQIFEKDKTNKTIYNGKK